MHGTDGVIRVESTNFTDPGKPSFRLTGAKRGDSELVEIEVADEKRGGWRVEEEFVNAIRGLEPVTHTDFTTGVKYMQFTDAVSQSVTTGELVRLPF